MDPKNNTTSENNMHQSNRNTLSGDAAVDSSIANQKAIDKQVQSLSGNAPSDTAPEQKRYAGKPTVRTYRDFAVNALKDKPTSLAKMIIKEKKKEEINYKYSPKNSKNIFMIVLSVLLVVLGIAAIAAIIIFSISKKNDIEEKSQPIAPKSVIYFDYKSENDISKASRSDIVKISKSAVETNIPIGEVKLYYFTKEDSSGYKRLATTKDFFAVIDTRAPDQFIRNLEDEFSFGVMSTADAALPFLILKLRDFDASYASSLAWERTMVLDMGDFFGINKKYYAQKFSDLSLYNKDARVILDEEGKVIFGYSFTDLHTMVFFTDNNGFKKIITNLQNNRERI